MTQSARDLESTFLRAWQLLLANPIVMLPGLIVAIVAAAVESYVFAPWASSIAITSTSGDANVGLAARSVESALYLAFAMVVYIAQVSFVTGMAGAAWERGRATLRDGWQAFARRGVQTLLAMALMLLIGLVAAAFAPVTFLLTLIAYVVFIIYTMPAVIIGGDDPVAGIAESCRLALGNLLPTVAVVAIIALLAWLSGALANAVSAFSPLGAAFISLVVEQVVVAYAMLVVTGEFLKLRTAPGGRAV